MYRERDKEKRKEFIEKLEQVTKEKVIYIDESGFTSHLIQTKCWSPIGEPVIGEQHGKRQKRVNLFCGLTSDFQSVAPFLTEENCCAGNFERWFESHLLWNVDPDATIVMDNARFHRKTFLFDLIKTFNAWYGRNIRLLFLPPYSPDLNPIENFFGTLKQKVRRCSHQFETIRATLINVLDI